MAIALFVDSQFRFTKGLVFKFGEFDVTVVVEVCF